MEGITPFENIIRMKQEKLDNLSSLVQKWVDLLGSLPVNKDFNIV